MSPLKELKVELLNPTRVYYPGQMVQGAVTAFLHHQMVSKKRGVANITPKNVIVTTVDKK
jgi:hypothetical protein